MKVEFITKEDLDQFKTELFEEIRKLTKSKAGNLGEKEWLKSYEVRKLLGISPGKLQNMRVNGTIAYTQIGGLMFYRYADIIKLMEDNKHQNPLSTRALYLNKCDLAGKKKSDLVKNIR